MTPAQKRLVRERAVMDLRGAEALLEKIKEMIGDDEAAHSLEDRLHVAALEAVIAGDKDAVEICRVALQTSQLDFSRWSA